MPGVLRKSGYTILQPFVGCLAGLGDSLSGQGDLIDYFAELATALPVSQRPPDASPEKFPAFS